MILGNINTMLKFCEWLRILSRTDKGLGFSLELYKIFLRKSPVSFNPLKIIKVCSKSGTKAKFV